MNYLGRLRRPIRSLLLGGALLALQPVPILAQSASTSASGSFSLSLNRTPLIQTAGDARVYLAVTNTSAAPISWFPEPWCILVRMTIVDSGGNSQFRDDSRRLGCTFRPAIGAYPNIALAPGETYQGGSGEVSGIPLAEWGYFLQPGVYSVRVFSTYLPGAAGLGATAITLTLH